MPKVCALGITEVIYSELLQGVDSESSWISMKRYLDSLPIFTNKRGLDFYSDSSRVYFLCRKSGITPRGILDSLVVQMAIDYDLYLLHNDNDYVKIKKVVKNLKFL